MIDIVYTCPKCKGDLIEICLPSCPPQYQYQCWDCGWKSKIRKPEYSCIRIPWKEEWDNEESNN